MIIGISGPTASGKTTVAKILEEYAGAFRTRYSDILIGIANERKLPHDKATLQNLYLSERAEKGEDFLAKAMEAKVQEMPYATIVIEGNRRLADIDMLRRIAINKNEELLFLFIDAPKEVRFTRFNNRLTQSGETPITQEAFDELESNGAEDELDDIKAIFEKEGTVIDASTQTPEQIFEIIKELL